MGKKFTSIAISTLVFASCANLDVKNIGSAMKAFDSKEISYHDSLIEFAKIQKIPASSFVDTYMATFQGEEYDKYKNDELTYTDKNADATARLQNTIQKSEMKAYKIQHNLTFGKYDTTRECFLMGDATLNDAGYLSKGDYFGIQFAPMIIDSDKSKFKLPSVMKLKPANKDQVNCLKVPKNLAGKITSLGEGRNTEVRFDFKVVSVSKKRMSFNRTKSPTKLQYLNNIDPGKEDVDADGLEVVIDIQTVKIFKPGFTDQLLTIYNLK